MPLAGSRSGSTKATGKNKPLPSLGKKAQTGLAVDTSFSQHRGQPPQQIYPRSLPISNTETPQRFISLSDLSQGSDIANNNSKGLLQQLESVARVRDGPQKALSGKALRRGQATESVHAYVDEITPPDLYHDAAKGQNAHQQALLNLPNPSRARQNKSSRRPAPLQLASGISPSDRAIPIGISVPSATLLEHGRPLEPATTDLHSSYATRPMSRTQELKTPTIIVTPAEEDHPSGLATWLKNLPQPAEYRPRSSVYSRYTNCAPKRHETDSAPPVPPLPRFAVEIMPKDNHVKSNPTAWASVREESPPYPASPPKDKTLSVFTEFEDDALTLPWASPDSARASSQAVLPTPRRSNGWWNIITSPFSSSPAARSVFLRSPPIAEEAEEEHRSILADASNMGRADGPSFTNRSEDDNELRSAPPVDGSQLAPGLRPLPLPKRCDTAPGALDLGSAGAVNIYRIPSCGEAAAYFDKDRRYPSFIASTARDGQDDPLGLGLEQGWSPLQSNVQKVPDVAPQESADRSGDESGVDAGQRGFKAPKVVMFESPSEEELGTAPAGVNEEPLPFAKSRSIAPPVADGPAVARDIQDVTPIEENASPNPFESEEQEPVQAVEQPSGHDTEVDDSMHEQGHHDYAPQLPTPIVENAYTAQVVRPVTLHNDPAHSEGEQDRSAYDFMSTLPPAERSPSLDSSDAPVSQFAGVYNEKRGEMSALDGSSDGAPPRERPSRRALLWLLLVLFIFSGVMAVLMVLLLFPFHSSNMAVEAQWLNLTGFPPMPTGVVTVVGAQNVKNVNGCVNPSALWSCDVPGGQGLSTTGQSQPNFRFLIRFRNDTVANETLLQPTNSTTLKRDSSRAAYAGAMVKRSLWSKTVFTPSPPPPSTSDQIFLGRTTDHNDVPYDGITTPFYISLLDPIALPLEKRSDIQKRGFHYPYPTPSDYNSTHTTATSNSTSSTSPSLRVPNAAINSNGEPAAPELYPFASAQPLRLFNRGQASEHYGFYTYFDRSLYIASPSNTSPSSNLTSTSTSSTTTNTGLNHSSSVCTWSQTRFLVQIWTRKGDVTSLRSTSSSSSTTTPAANSTANDMASPGSLPYPMTITLDRNGGTASEKGVYCYNLDAAHEVIKGSGTWIPENRAFGGTIVNAAPVPTDNGTSSTSPLLSRRDGEGGIDGGTGGCACQWQNFA